MPILRIIVLATLLAPAISLAADNTGHSVGFVAGPTYGLGLSYGRHNSATGNGWQVSGFPYWSQEDRYLFGGLTLFKTLHQGEWARAFFSGGVAAFYRRSEKWDFVDAELDVKVKQDVEVGLRVRQKHRRKTRCRSGARRGVRDRHQKHRRFHGRNRHFHRVRRWLCHPPHSQFRLALPLVTPLTITS